MFLISIEDCIRVYVDTMSLEFFNVFLKCEDLEKSRVRKKTPYRIFIFEKQNLNEKDLKMRSRMSELIFQGMSPNAVLVIGLQGTVLISTSLAAVVAPSVSPQILLCT